LFLLGFEQGIKLKPADAIKLKSDVAIAHSNRGIAYNKLGQYQRAIEEYNEAIRLKPDLAEVYSDRGIAYAKLANINVPLMIITRPYAWNRI